MFKTELVTVLVILVGWAGVSTLLHWIEVADTGTLITAMFIVVMALLIGIILFATFGMSGALNQQEDDD